MAGGYRISRALKQILMDIYHQAMIGLDLVATSDGLSVEEQKRIDRTYKKIINLVRDTGVV
jgi:hypothetical protein